MTLLRNHSIIDFGKINTERNIHLYEIKLDAVVPAEPKRVYKVEVDGSNLTETDLDFTYENGKVKIDVNKIAMHAMVVIDM